MKIAWILLIMGLSVSCSLLQKSRTSIDAQDPEQILYRNIETSEKKRELQEVVLLTDSYQRDFPYSLKLQKVRFIRASALEEMGRWGEAAEVYQIISKFSERNQPEISVLSTYRLSFVYEALGDDQKVLTSLLEAKKNENYLPIEIGMAEIPSRIAMVYARENNSSEAMRWLQQADRGLKKAVENRREPLTDEWLAKTYFNMGTTSTNQVSSENILSLIMGQQVVQKYLIRGLLLNDPTWSAKALTRLQGAYSDLWSAIENYPDPSGYEPLVAAKMKREEQVRFIEPFLNLIKDAQLYRPLGNQADSGIQKTFFAYLDELQTRVESLLKSPIYTPLVGSRRAG